MKTIPLTRNRVALVDDEDHEWLNQRKWYAKQGRGDTFYARRRFGGDFVYMHRAILGFKKGDGNEIDHRDGDGLNNQRSNLRACTRSQSNQNKRKRKNARSQYKGICYHKRDKKWYARITVESKRMSLGYFTSEKAAGLAYNRAALKHFREFARLNIFEKGKKK